MFLKKSAICMRRLCLPLRGISSWQLAFKEHGEPLDVLFEREQNVINPGNKKVLINFRAAPVNPSDINTIQGKYPLKPTLPAVPGNEGAGYVMECGQGVSNFKPGDLVIPGRPSLGTWQTSAIFDENDLVKLNPKLSCEQASVISVNPSTAYLMLTSYADLKSGDCVIQNGATSAVGIYVMQMCRLMGIKTINLFRKRDTPEKTEETRQALLDFGGNLVLTEDELMQREDIASYGPIRLGLNCLGGKPTLAIIKVLSQSGILVTYGGMTRQPIPTPIGPLIFKDIQLRGFWLSGRSDNHSKRIFIFDLLSNWMIDGSLQLSPYEAIPHLNWKSAIEKSIFRDGPPKGLPSKAILTFPETK